MWVDVWVNIYAARPNTESRRWMLRASLHTNASPRQSPYVPKPKRPRCGCSRSLALLKEALRLH